MGNHVLVVCGSTAEPHRLGESARLEIGSHVMDTLPFVQERPFDTVVGPPLEGTADVTLYVGETIEVESQRPIYVGGKLLGAGRREVTLHTTLRIDDAVLLYVTERPPLAPLKSFPPSAARAFGEPDAVGVVGESSSAWRFRDALAEAAQSGKGVLITSGDFLVADATAKAVHGLSARAHKRCWDSGAWGYAWDIVFYGNGMRGPDDTEHEGMFELAHEGSLLINAVCAPPDERLIGALRKYQAYGGMYYRIADDVPRRSDFVTLVAMRRGADLEALAPEIRSRIELHVDVPALADRREDVPLCVRHMMMKDGHADIVLPLDALERLVLLEHALVDEVAPNAVHVAVRPILDKRTPQQAPVVKNSYVPPPIDPRIDVGARRRTITLVPIPDVSEPHRDEHIAHLRDKNAKTVAEWCNGWLLRGYALDELAALVFESDRRPMVLRLVDIEVILPNVARELRQAETPPSEIAVATMRHDYVVAVSSMTIPKMVVEDTRWLLRAMSKTDHERVEARIDELCSSLRSALCEWGFGHADDAGIVLTAEGRARIVDLRSLSRDAFERPLFAAADYPAEYGHTPVLVLPEGDEGPAVVWRADLAGLTWHDRQLGPTSSDV